MVKSKALKVRRKHWPSVGKASLVSPPSASRLRCRSEPRERARHTPPKPDHVSQPNSERPAPVSAASDWPPGGGAIVRRPNRSSVSHGFPWPRPQGRRQRRPDSSHWQTASGPECGRAEQRRRRRARSSAAPRTPRRPQPQEPGVPALSPAASRRSGTSVAGDRSLLDTPQGGEGRTAKQRLLLG
ncbi:uncharacterized protein C10orf95-like isoform X2 [Acinonyx jubatus]|uniref:Uncharacterized protein C10orf95-like isoform X2 n=1 Tax=Acinonyx jubatus TaxID=32536 RepID=A0ABM3PY54_ACIJB|nr:uncharacterized protein C10orf95-like isoform X2 [Acinonyx jubatus]